MNSPHIRFAIIGWLQAAVLTFLTTSCLADPGAAASNARLALRTDPLSVSTTDVTRFAVYAPGQHESRVLSVFKIRVDPIVPDFLGLEGDALRPYLLGGRTSLRLPSGNTVGEALLGSAESQALHIGAGAEVRLRDRLFLSLDFGEILHSGPLSRLSYRTYKLGFLYDF